MYTKLHNTTLYKCRCLKVEKLEKNLKTGEHNEDLTERWNAVEAKLKKGSKNNLCIYMFLTGSVFGIWWRTKLDEAIFKKKHRDSRVVLCERTE